MFKFSSPTTKFPLKSIYGIFTAGLLAFTSLNFPEKANQNRAYRDVLGRPAICAGHLKNVKMTDMVSNDTCDKFLHDDMFWAIDTALTINPTLVENKNALRAASEFIMTSRENAFTHSPMALHFTNRNWVEGCQAFKSFMIHAEFKTKKVKHECFKTTTGRWVCKVPELVKIREEQSNICLGRI